MEDEVLIKYKEFLKGIEDGNIPEMTIDCFYDPNGGLNFVGVSPIGGNADFYFELDPYQDNSRKVLLALELYKNDEIIVSRRDLVEKVFPEISSLVRNALEERDDPSYNEDILSDDYKPRIREDVICLMEAIEQGSDVKLDYNWGL